MVDSFMTIEVWDGAGAGRYAVASVDELFALLDFEGRRAEHDRCFPLGAIDRSGKDMLLVGIGGESSAIEYYFGDEEESSLMAVSDGEAAPVSFYAAGHESEYPPSCAIPKETARQIIREYAENGTLSELVQWEPP